MVKTGKVTFVLCMKFCLLPESGHLVPDSFLIIVQVTLFFFWSLKGHAEVIVNGDVDPLADDPDKLLNCHGVVHHQGAHRQVHGAHPQHPLGLPVLQGVLDRFIMIVITRNKYLCLENLLVRVPYDATLNMTSAKG